MTYSVKEIYYTLQGEGAHTGRPAVFLRFAGCNLWSGREEHRAEAVCRFCDTEFVGTDGPGGGKFETAGELAAAIGTTWESEEPGVTRYVVCTGGEPLLQLDKALIDALHEAGFEIGVESNGTLTAPEGIDWLCISPKGSAPVVQSSGNELKLVFPQQEDEAQPANFIDLEFEQFFLQPLDGPDVQANTRRAIEYCLSHPRWRLSVQTHKVLGID
ncbi:MAG: 7-carboxy-7-deazaguanine synthase [Gammaproteobacteria bacterium]|jgi:7-carboxy-7-deazaguanine synthase (Cx14CxxC type)|nr:7-carboxy-7-deazaguanine synthase [Gammaproteobacteria bacterium]